MTWQPIETAPKDGSRILMFDAFCGGYIHAVRWIKEPHNCWHIDTGATPVKPTHWQPLPAPPAADAPIPNRKSVGR